MELLLLIVVIAFVVVLCVKSEGKPRIDKEGRFIIRRSEDPETYYRVKAMKEGWEEKKKDPCFPFTSYDIPEHIKKEYPYIKKIGTSESDGCTYWLDINGHDFKVNIDINGYTPCSKENIEMVTSIYNKQLKKENIKKWDELRELKNKAEESKELLRQYELKMTCKDLFKNYKEDATDSEKKLLDDILQKVFKGV